MTGPRPDTLLVVVGTATEVGKTWTAARLLATIAATGRTVAARKPAQSFAEGAPEPTDAEVLASATGEHPSRVCAPHRTYPVAMAPPMAADVLGRPVPRLAQLLDELSWDPGTSVGLVEAVGGLRSPLAADGDSLDLVTALRPDLVVLVADAGLGTIDAVRSAHHALAGHDVVTYLNRFDPDDDLHRRNAAWLRDVDHFHVVTSLALLAERV